MQTLNIVMLIDALGFEVARHYGFCERLHLVLRPMETVLGYSSAAITSIFSGKLPSENGVWTMYRYDPEGSPFKFLRILPSLPHALERRIRIMTRRIADKRAVTSAYYDLYEIPLRMLRYFDLAQRVDPYGPTGEDPEGFFDRIEAGNIPYNVWTYRTPEASNAEELLNRMAGDDCLLFFYTAELDSIMHRVGIEDQEVEEKLAWYEALIERILARGRDIGRPVALYVFSDHGMANVNGSVDIWGDLTRCGYRLGRDYKAFYDSTLARFWANEKNMKGIQEVLTSTGGGRVLTDDELTAFGCYFTDRSYGELVYLTDPGIMIVPSFMGREQIAAMHGYDPDDAFSKACFLTNDPHLGAPESILDLRPLLLDRIIGSG